MTILEQGPYNWQSNLHTPIRKEIIKLLHLMIRKSGQNISKFIRGIELLLYSKAASLEEYNNYSTLKRRILHLRSVARRQKGNPNMKYKPSKPISSSTIGEPKSVLILEQSDILHHIFSYLSGIEIIRCAVLNREAAHSLPSYVETLTLSLQQLRAGLDTNILQK
jgi:hypothetical protein